MINEFKINHPITVHDRLKFQLNLLYLGETFKSDLN